MQSGDLHVIHLIGDRMSSISRQPVDATSDQKMRENRLEADHRLAHSLPRSRDRKAALVRPALEDRGVSQDLEIGVPSRRGAAQKRGALGEAG